MKRERGLRQTQAVLFRVVGPGRDGFTLVELLVVIAMIAILLALLFPNLGSARERAMTVKCMSRQQQIATASFTYAAEHEGLLPPFIWYGRVGTFNVNHWPYHFFITGQGWENMGHLWNDGYIRDGRNFYCPAIDGGNIPENYTHWPSPWGSSPWANAVRSTYDFNPEKGSDSRRDHERSYTLSADALLLADGILNEPRHQGGYVITRGDGSVHRVVSPEAWEVRCAAGAGIHYQNFSSYDRIIDLLMERTESTP